jgi:hypothetical protein
MKNAYEMLFGKAEEKKSLVRRTHGQAGGIRMHPGELRSMTVDWIHLAQIGPSEVGKKHSGS